MNKQYYCPVCQKETSFVVQNRSNTITLEDGYSKFNEKVAFCKKCGEELFVDELNKENQELFMDNFILNGQKEKANHSYKVICDINDEIKNFCKENSIVIIKNFKTATFVGKRDKLKKLHKKFFEEYTFETFVRK